MAFLHNLYASLSVLPFLTFLVLWFILYVWRKDKKFATIRAMDVTMVFLIGAVSGLLDQVLGLNFGGLWMIVLVMLIAIGLLGNAQQRMKGKVDVIKAVRIVWRIGFMVLCVLYVVLMLIGMITYAAA